MTLNLWCHDIFTHWPHDCKEFGLLSFRDELALDELVQRDPQIFDQGIKVGGRNTHALMDRLHIFPRVLAGTATGLAELVYELVIQGSEVGISKETLNTRISSNTRDKVRNYGLDGSAASQPFVQRLLLACHVFPSGRTASQADDAHQAACQPALPSHLLSSCGRDGEASTCLPGLSRSSGALVYSLLSSGIQPNSGLQLCLSTTARAR